MKFQRIGASGLRWLWLVVVLIALDQYTKVWMMQHLLPFQPVEVLSFFNFTLAYNTGAAFSFLHAASGWQNWLLGGLAVVVSVFLLLWLSRISYKERWLSIAICLILTGALGNAWDRVRYGFVVDFFDFHLGDWHFAIFNVADVAICVGAAMMIMSWVLFPQK